MDTFNLKAGVNLISKVLLTFAALFMSAMVFAQDGGGAVDVNIKSDGGGGFLGSPWVWVIGAAVFILLLVALLRGGGKKSDV